MKTVALVCGIVLFVPFTKAKAQIAAATSTYNFTTNTYRVSERIVKAVLTITRTGTVTAQGRVNYATTVNSARPDDDFKPVSGQLTWAAGESASKQIQIDIVRDAFEEEPQDFFVELSTPVGGVLGSRKTANVIIDDPAVRIEELWTSVYQAPASLPLLASLTAINATRVEFLEGVNILGTDATPRAGDGYYEFNWNNIPRGAYTIRARAVEADGTTTFSPARTILITGPGLGIGLATVHVAETNNTGLENGSALNPFTTIQKAIDNASPNATIKIAGGTYRESLILDFGPVQLLGGYSSDFNTRDARNNRVTIIPPARGLGIGLFNPLASQIDGLTISNAARGIYIFAESLAQSSPKLSHNVITACGEGFRAFGGGGIHAENSNLEISDNEITYNKGGRGAGISAGAAGASIAIRNNLITHNDAYDDHGGGLYIMANGVIANNRIDHNVVGFAVDYGGWGGGLIVFGNSFDFAPQIVLSNNIVSDNFASSGSAEFFDEGAKAVVSNELIYDNAGAGPAIYVDGCCNSSLQLINATVANNEGGGLITDTDSSATVSNSIFWNPNFEEFAAVNGSTLQISYTLSEQPIATGNGITAGAGNISTDPLFADAPNADYRLKTTRERWSPRGQEWVTDFVNSPAIDAGNPTSNFSGESIPNGNRVDLGAYGNRSDTRLSASLNNQQLRISVRGAGTRSYILESSADMKTWDAITTLTSPTGALEHTATIQSTPTFYRLQH